MPNIKQRKIALMGFREVGKSSISIQFTQGQFPDCYEPTIENTFSKKVTIKGTEYELLLVDTAGQDEYTMFPTEYTVDLDGYVLVYSIDSPKSFEVCQIFHETSAKENQGVADIFTRVVSEIEKDSDEQTKD